MKTLALFDFDNTLYDKDSLLEFTKFSRGHLSFYLGILLLSPYLLGLKLHLFDNEKVKQKFISYFFRGLSYDKFITLGHEFATTKIHRNLNKSNFAAFKSHVEFKHQVYIVSASAPEWIEPWSSSYNVKVIGTKIRFSSGRLTGGFASPNCYGIEKTNRIKELINLSEFDSIFVYGSGKGDYEMLKLANAV